MDFVVRKGKTLTAIEVKSQYKKSKLSGMAAFSSAFPSVRKLLIGGDGIKIEKFLSKAPEHWISKN